MGTWGSGNFDGDTAADHLSIVTQRLIDQIEEQFQAGEVGPEDWGGAVVPCNLELLALLAKQRWVGVMLPKPAQVAKWKKRFLAEWKDVSRERVKVLAKTFDAVTRLGRAETTSGSRRGTR